MRMGRFAFPIPKSLSKIFKVVDAILDATRQGNFVRLSQTEIVRNRFEAYRWIVRGSVEGISSYERMPARSCATVCLLDQDRTKSPGRHFCSSFETQGATGVKKRLVGGEQVGPWHKHLAPGVITSDCVGKSSGESCTVSCDVGFEGGPAQHQY